MLRQPDTSHSMKQDSMRRVLTPESNDGLDREVVFRTIRHISVVRTLWWSVRHRGWCVLARGTKLKVGHGSKLDIPPGSFLFIGFAHFTSSPCSIHLGRNATLSVRGTAQFLRGTRIFVNDGGHLEVGTRSYINDCSTVTCFENIKIGSGCSISWNTNILDTNVHELIVRGSPKPRSEPVAIGDHVWIGTGATILAGTTIGDNAIVAAGSVVTSDVQPGTLVGGNPARVISEHASWRQ
jgi:acetyltransferase-like isoleucine patch superfamily enzyme